MELSWNKTNSKHYRVRSTMLLETLLGLKTFHQLAYHLPQILDKSLWLHPLSHKCRPKWTDQTKRGITYSSTKCTGFLPFPAVNINGHMHCMAKLQHYEQALGSTGCVACKFYQQVTLSRGHTRGDMEAGFVPFYGHVFCEFLRMHNCCS